MRLHLAGEAIPLGRLVLRQRVLQVIASVERPGLHEHPARPARAIPTIERNIDADPVRSIRHRLVRPRLDDAREPVLEVQCDGMGH